VFITFVRPKSIEPKKSNICRHTNKPDSNNSADGARPSLQIDGNGDAVGGRGGLFHVSFDSFDEASVEALIAE